LGVRVKVELGVGKRRKVVSALVNTGFESDGPDIGVPTEVAQELGLWPPKGFRLEEAQTAGGKSYLFATPQKARIRLLLGTRSDPEVEGNILISPHLDEVILSDYLTEELGIIIVSLRRGLWRHKTDPPEVTRGPP
jgi:hypothetical protein